MSDVKKCSNLRWTNVGLFWEGLEKQLVEWVKSDDEKTRDRMMKNAQAVANRGMDAVLALMARGWRATCKRLIRKVQRGDLEGLLKQFTLQKQSMQEPPILGLIESNSIILTLSTASTTSPSSHQSTAINVGRFPWSSAISMLSVKSTSFASEARLGSIILLVFNQLFIWKMR